MYGQRDYHPFFNTRWVTGVDVWQGCFCSNSWVASLLSESEFWSCWYQKLMKNTLWFPDLSCRPPLRFVDANWRLTLIPHLLGHMVLIGPQACNRVKFYIFRLFYKLTSHNLWPQEHVKVPTLYQKNKYNSIRLQHSKMRWISHFEPILQLHLWWPLTLVYDIWLYEHTMGPTMYQ